MKVEVWSDIMCPFCYIGKRNYEKALSQFAPRDEVEIIWKSFQLDPSIPQEMEKKVSVYQYLADRKGLSYQQSMHMHKGVVETAKNAGLIYNFDIAIVANSFQAHRIIQMAKTKGLGDQAEERFFHAYFTEGKDCADRKVLLELARATGLSDADTDEALNNDFYAILVKEDIQEAKSLGINGVPFFVFNRTYAVSGAQPPEVFLDTLKQAFEEWKKDNT